MHDNEYTARIKAAQLLAVCRRGFSNEFEWFAWRKKHAKEIEALPLNLRNEVMLAWDQSTAKEFSR
jgi:hypothetical protein